MADVTLTSALRSNLLSLQGTQKLPGQPQFRLSTGLKVNSALDNPSSFFAAQSLNNRAGDLANLLHGMDQAVQVLKAADRGIQAITNLLEQAQAVAQEAKDALSADPDADVTPQGASFDAIIGQVNALAGDSGYRGANLLKGAATLSVNFSEATAPSSLSITGYDFTTAGGLSSTTVGGDFSDVTAQDAIDAARADLTLLRNAASALSANLNVIQTRQEFTSNLINTLKEGADKLAAAGNSEEGAKLLSLRTTQQLDVTSLSLALQANQSILRLFQ